MRLTPSHLDGYARRYYLSGAVQDLDIEELSQRMAIDRIAAALPEGGRVLEMGVGTGLVVSELLAREVCVEVVEGSPLLAEDARERFPGLIVQEAMFESFQPTWPYDAVLALHVLEHVDDPVAMLRQVATWLRPAGTLVAVVPNRESLHRRLAVLMGLQERLDDLSDRDRLVGHLRVYSLDDLEADLAAAGLAPRERFGHQLKTLPNAMMLDWPAALHEAMNAISPDLPPQVLANVGVVATRP